MKKFLFDTHDFDTPEVIDDTPSFKAEHLEAARAEGYHKGKQDGRAEAAREALEAQEEKIRILLDGASIALGRLASEEDRRETEKCIDAARLALHAIHKLMPKLALDHGLPEIERLIAAAMDARHDEPRIAMTVPTALLESLRQRIDPLATERGFLGKAILIADDTLGPSDCRIGWADGGTERLMTRLMMQLENEFSRAIAGMGQTLETTAAAPAPATDKEKPQEETPAPLATDDPHSA